MKPNHAAGWYKFLSYHPCTPRTLPLRNHAIMMSACNQIKPMHTIIPSKGMHNITTE